ncbi:terpene synthase family protein [Kitasatospora sp. LaBMicrA B282]|uniref:terpene synthase family protein n=1 Tax=Kitasatospora sp. LaBMicrA B282 TaxID=3420949 RepID=UPI003D0AD398
MAERAVSAPQPTAGLLRADQILTTHQLASPRCIGCGAAGAPHLGETQSLRVADGVVRDVRVRRCTPCQQQHTAPTDHRHAGLYADVRDWLERYRLHPDPETYLAHGYLDLCLRAWPGADGLPLQLATQWAVWMWRADDAFDTDLLVADPKEAAGLAAALLYAVSGQGLPREARPLAHALAELRMQTRAVMPGFWWDRYRTALEAWVVSAEAKLSRYVRPGRVPSLAEYLKLRPADGGMQLAAMWCELANLCVVPDWRDSLVQEMVQAFSAVGVLLNDLAAEPGDTFTAVRAVVCTEGMSVEDARAEVLQLLRAEEHRFIVRVWAVRAMAVDSASESTRPGEFRQDTRAFAALLDRFRRALATWTLESSRYAGVPQCAEAAR